MKKKSGNNFRQFEGRKSNDRHVRITLDMTKSEAWLNLKPSSVVLYLSIKIRYDGKNHDNIEFPYSEAHKLGLSNDTTKKCFAELCEKGFIEMMNCGRFSRTANVYKLSSNWQAWRAIK